MFFFADIWEKLMSKLKEKSLWKHKAKAGFGTSKIQIL